MKGAGIIVDRSVELREVLEPLAGGLAAQLAAPGPPVAGLGWGHLIMMAPQRQRTKDREGAVLSGPDGVVTTIGKQRRFTLLCGYRLVLYCV